MCVHTAQEERGQRTACRKSVLSFYYVEGLTWVFKLGDKHFKQRGHLCLPLMFFKDLLVCVCVLA